MTPPSRPVKRNRASRASSITRPAKTLAMAPRSVTGSRLTYPSATAETSRPELAPGNTRTVSSPGRSAARHASAAAGPAIACARVVHGLQSIWMPACPYSDPATASARATDSSSTLARLNTRTRTRGRTASIRASIDCAAATHASVRLTAASV